jgi:hypothetical protein
MDWLRNQKVYSSIKGYAGRGLLTTSAVLPYHEKSCVKGPRGTLVNPVRFVVGVVRLWIFLWRARGPLRRIASGIEAETQRVQAIYGTQYVALHACLVDFLASQDPVGHAGDRPGRSRERVEKLYDWPAVRILGELAGSRSSDDVRHRLYRDVQRWVDGLGSNTHLGAESDYAEVAERLWALMVLTEHAQVRSRARHRRLSGRSGGPGVHQRKRAGNG